jgi:hypothetical protein
MIGAVLAVSVLFAQAAPDAAAPPPAAAPAAPTKAVSPVTVTGVKPPGAAGAKGDELVCRTEPVLGTLFPKRICARRDEIAQRTREDQKETREATNLRPWRDPSGP